MYNLLSYCSFDPIVSRVMVGMGLLTGSYQVEYNSNGPPSLKSSNPPKHCYTAPEPGQAVQRGQSLLRRQNFATGLGI